MRTGATDDHDHLKKKEEIQKKKNALGKKRSRKSDME
jgi:hypothetical protein